MFKSKIIFPFVVLFLVCCLFLIINVKNYSYNSEIIENDLLLNKDLKLSLQDNSNVSDIKSNNDKIENYIFEHLEIGNGIQIDDNSVIYETSQDNMQKQLDSLYRENKKREEQKRSELELANHQLELSKSKIERIKKEGDLLNKMKNSAINLLGNKLKNLHLDEKIKNLHLDEKIKNLHLDEKIKKTNKECIGTVKFGNYKGQPCSVGYNSVINSSNVNNGNRWCNVVGGCSLVDTKNELPSKPELDYKEYPGVLQFGNDKAGDFEDSSLGCQNKTFKDAKELCQKTDDCNSFFAYEGKSDKPGRVCFKNNAKRDKPQTKYNDAEHPNAGYYFV